MVAPQCMCCGVYLSRRCRPLWSSMWYRGMVWKRLQPSDRIRGSRVFRMRLCQRCFFRRIYTHSGVSSVSAFSDTSLLLQEVRRNRVDLVDRRPDGQLRSEQQAAVLRNTSGVNRSETILHCRRLNRPYKVTYTLNNSKTAKRHLLLQSTA